MKKIPPDAFDFYFALGPPRSYQVVAERYGVTKRAVTNYAKRENWQQRLLEVEAEARARSDRKKVDALEVVQDRHLKALRLVLGKGIEGLRQTSIDKPFDAVRAIGLAIREERITLGEPGDRTAVTIEDTIKREYERWMSVAEGEPEPEDEPEPDDDDPGEVPAKGSC